MNDRKRPYPRPTGKVWEDGSYDSVGGWYRDAETKKMRRDLPKKKRIGRSGIVEALSKTK